METRSITPADRGRPSDVRVNQAPLVPALQPQPTEVNQEDILRELEQQFRNEVQVEPTAYSILV